MPSMLPTPLLLLLWIVYAAPPSIKADAASTSTGIETTVRATKVSTSSALGAQHGRTFRAGKDSVGAASLAAFGFECRPSSATSIPSPLGNSGSDARKRLGGVISFRDQNSSRLSFQTKTPCFFHRHNRQRYPRHCDLVLGGAAADEILAPLEDITEDKFSRWTFLQDVLEGDVSSTDTARILRVVLEAYLLHGPIGEDANPGEASPVLNAERRCSIEELLRILRGEGVDVKASATRLEASVVLPLIEALLPNPDEDEESHKGAWDVVMDLHGRESVRIHEERQQLQAGDSCASANGDWRMHCAVVRVFIYYDFLTKGVLKEGMF